MGLNQVALPNLPALRQQKGITLESIAASTRIGRRYLEAIERGDFTVLPGGIYNISYIRQYARATDFDEDVLLECYFAATGSAEPANTPAEAVTDANPLPWPGQYLPLIPRNLFNVSIRKLRKT